jgi:hypothetical protein
VRVSILGCSKQWRGKRRPDAAVDVRPEIEKPLHCIHAVAAQVEIEGSQLLKAVLMFSV